MNFVKAQLEKAERFVETVEQKVAERVAKHLQRRLEEDDWRPYKSRQDAVRAWRRLGGIRLQVMEALGLLNDQNNESEDPH